MTDSTVLMERECAGVSVELKWLPLMDAIVIEACNSDCCRSAIVPPDKAMDAFNHPALYIQLPQDIFLSRKEVSDD